MDTKGHRVNKHINEKPMRDIINSDEVKATLLDIMVENMDLETMVQNLKDYIWGEWECDSTVLENDRELNKEELNRRLHNQLHVGVYAECTETHHRDCKCSIVEHHIDTMYI